MREFMSLVESSFVNPQEAVLAEMWTKANHDRFMAWFEDNGDQEAKDDPQALLWEFEYYLKDELSINVGEDGIIQFWKPDDEAIKLIGNNPIRLYHYTSSTNVPAIRAHGLTSGNKSVNRTDRPGVYLTTEYGTRATDGYHYNAVNAVRGKARDTAHGVVVEVWMRLSELQGDMDDADISSGQHQYVCDHVPPDRIISIERA